MKERIKSYLFIIILSIIVSIPLFNSDINIYIDDGIQHVCRLMGTYQSLEEGQTFPVIMSNFCNGFGYSWNLFYSPITAYVPLLFGIFTNSFVVCLKLFMILVTILSGFSMYEFLYKTTQNRYIGILGSAIYIFAPYRLTDMYMRIAIAELTSFIFLPMVFQGLFTIFKEEQENEQHSIMLLSIGAIGLILSHIIMAMYTAIFALIYVVINFKKMKNKIILKKILLSLIFIVTITSFFWAPMLENKLNTQYEVFKEGRMERTPVLIELKLNIIDLIYTEQGSLIFEIGLVTIVGLILTILCFKKIDKEYKKIYLFFIVAGIISVIMTLKIFPFEKLPSILKMLQFSFRMLEFSSFFLSSVVAINYGKIIKEFKFRDVMILTIITIFLTIPITKNLQYISNINESILWPAVQVNDDTGRVHAGCASFEYLPSKAFNNLNYIKIRENKIIVLQGNAKILEENKDGTNLKCIIEDTEENTLLELPYIYYLGYTAKLTTNDNVENIKIEESQNGFLQIALEKDQEGILEIKYEGSILMKLSLIVSLISFIIFIIYVFAIKRRE